MASNDELFEIMSWVSPKSLYKLAPVAKPFKDILSENAFMEKQCRNSLRKPEESLIIQDNSYLGIRASKLTLSFLPEHRHDNGIPIKSLRFITTKSRILQSSNGLLLCWTIDSNKPTKLVLYNLVTKTREYVKYPTKALAKNKCMNNLTFILTCGNLFGKKNKQFPLDYTILAFTKHFSIDNPEDWSTGYDLHMFKEGKWLLKGENLAPGFNDLNLDYHACCKDGIFFVSEFGVCHQDHPNYLPYIVYFDIENASAKKIALPKQEPINITKDNCNFRVFGWDRKDGNSWFESICLAMNWHDEMNIWVLEDANTMDDKSSSPWRKILSLSIVDDLGFKDYITWARSFTILNKKMIFADREGYIYRCGLEGGKFGELEIICKHHDTVGFAGLRINSYSTTIRPSLKSSSKL